MRAVYLIAALAVAMVQPATPQTETEQNNQRQQRAFAEHQRRDHARHRFLGYSGSAYGSDLWSSRPRYAKDTRPSFVSFTTLAAPKPARKSYEKGRRAAAADNLDAAARHLEQAVELYPDYAAAWALLGRVRVHAGRNVDAARALRRSVEIDSKYLEPYPYLAYLAVIESDWPEVVRLGDEMIAVNSLFTLGHYYRGYALLQQGRIEPAEQSLRIALSTPDQRRFPDVHYVLGEVLRRRALFSSAALEYRLYAEVAPDGEWAEKAREWLREWANLGLISADQAEVR